MARSVQAAQSPSGIALDRDHLAVVKQTIDREVHLLRGRLVRPDRGAVAIPQQSGRADVVGVAMSQEHRRQPGSVAHPVLQLLRETLLFLDSRRSRIDDEQPSLAERQTVRVPRRRQGGCAERDHVDTRTDLVAARVAGGERLVHPESLECRLHRERVQQLQNQRHGRRELELLSPPPTPGITRLHPLQRDELSGDELLVAHGYLIDQIEARVKPPRTRCRRHEDAGRLESRPIHPQVVALQKLLKEQLSIEQRLAPLSTFVR